MKGQTSYLTLNVYFLGKDLTREFNSDCSGRNVFYFTFSFAFADCSGRNVFYFTFSLTFAYSRYFPMAIPSDSLACPYQSVAGHPG